MGTTQTVHRRACEDFAAKLEQGDMKKNSYYCEKKVRFLRKHCYRYLYLCGVKALSLKASVIYYLLVYFLLSFTVNNRDLKHGKCSY